MLIPLPPGEALHVCIQPCSELHCGCHQQSTDGSKPQALLCMGEFNPIHNVKGGSGTSGDVGTGKPFSVGSPRGENKQNTESRN